MSADLINQPELYESPKIPEDKKDRLRVAGKDLVLGVDYDRIDVTYPLNTQEVYAYTLNSVAVYSIEINYTDASKKDILNVRVI